MKDINLLDSLIKNNSIQIGKDAKDWKQAVNISLAPLISSGAIEERYVDAVISSTISYGPYYLISDITAMPHARPEDGVLKNAFSLTTFNNVFKFENDGRGIKILIALAATSADIHVSSALPQVVAVFENPEIELEIANAKTKEKIIEIIKKIDFSKYITE